MRKEVDEKYLNKIYLNILKAIVMIFYFLVLNIAYQNVNQEHLELGIKILTMIFLFGAIIIFEIAYKKDDDNLAIQGIEILVLSIYTITTLHITNKYKFDFRKYSVIASYIFAIYFIMNCIIIYTKGRKALVDDLSDIREIVKKEEPQKKEASKKKVENIENVENDSENQVKQKEKKKTKKKSSKKKKANKKVNSTEKERKIKEEEKQND